ncbi:MAG: carbohydrate kinase family protein [Microgenomates group bacterium]
MYDVISIGSATFDVFLKVPEGKILETEEFLVGKALGLPYGSKIEIKERLLASGGGGTNTAVGFARLGLKTAVVARCGWDFGGKLVRQELKKEGVDDSLLVQIEGDDTDYSTILIGPDGERTILVYRGKTRLDESLIDFSRLKSRWFCISGLEGNLKLLKKLVDWAKRNKIKVAVNPGRKEIDQREELLEIIKDIEVLIVNQEEAARLTNSFFFDLDLFSKTALLSSGIVVITRGAEGAYLFDKNDNLLIADGFKVEMVDATGAGDAFNAGFIGGLAKGWSLEKALKLGIANGAAVVMQMGVKPGLLSEKNYHNWLERPLKMEWKNK